MKATKPRLVSTASVQSDWYGWLPEAKMQAFQVYAAEVESCYIMLSISLDEAISLRESGYLTKSFQLVGVTSALCSRLSDRLQALLHSLDEHAKHYGIVPSVAPLDAENFRGPRGQRSARMSSLLSVVLLSRRAQFLSKITTLKHIVGELCSDFREAAEDLSTAATPNRDHLWTALDHNHFDLNTCLREAMVLLKCFLRVLPDDQLSSFQKTVASQTVAHRRVPVRSVIRHRRIAQFAGE